MMIVEIEGKKYSDSNVKSLMKEHEKVMSMLPKNGNFNDAADGLLHSSIQNNNVSLTKFLIQNGCTFDLVNENGETPLIMALKSRRLEQIELLLAANANLQNTDVNGKSALTMVFELRHREKELQIIKLVLTKLSVIHANEEKLTKTLIDAGCSLDIAVYFNNPSLMKRMLDNGYDVNAKHRNNSDNTAMHVAAMLNYLEVIKVLLQYGADRTVTNKRGYIPLVHGIVRQSKQDSDVIEVLMPDNFDWTEINIKCNTKDRLPLFHIFTEGTKETLEIFQSRYNIDFHLQDRYGETPLHYLMTNKNEGILEPFRNAKFDVNTQDFCTRTTALHLAASSGVPDTVSFLLNRGADVDLEDLFQKTPLLHVFNGISRHGISEVSPHKMKNFEECIELLIAHGANAEVESLRSFGTVLDWVRYTKIYQLINPILAHFALLEISGKQIKKRTHDKIHFDDQLKNYYELCKQQVEKTKMQFLRGRLTVYKVLTEHEEHIALYMRRQEITNEFVITEFQLESYYTWLLKKRLSDAKIVSYLRRNVASLLTEAIGLLNPNHLAIENIVCMLNKCNLQEFLV